MESRSKLVLFVFVLFFFSCSIVSKEENTKEENLTPKIKEETMKWKNAATCLCLKKSIPLNDSLIRQDGSIAAYIQTSDLGMESLLKIDSFVTNYLDTCNYKSKTGSSLSMMKCLDLHNSKELNSYIENIILDAK